MNRLRNGILAIVICMLPFPASAQSGTADQEVMAALNAFLEGWNSRDIERFADALHFPHFILDAGSARIFLERSDLTELGDEAWAHVPQEWNHTEWRAREIVQRLGDVVHVIGTWARINHDGEVFRTADVLYVVVKKEGRWRIQARSGNRGPRSP